MAKNKTIEYRQEGFLFVKEFLENHTLRDLEHEIYNRKATMITMNRPHDEIIASKGHDVMRDFIYAGQDIIFMAVLKTRKFGKTRLERNLRYVRDRRRNNFIGACERKYANAESLKKVFKEKDKHGVTSGVAVLPKLDNATKEYIQAKEAGIIRAYEIVKEFGYNELCKQVRIDKHNKKMQYKEDVFCDEIAMIHFNEAAISDWMIALNKNEGYGEKRLNDVLDEFVLAYDAVEKGIVGYENYALMLSDALGYEYECFPLKEDDHYDFVPWENVVKEVIGEENIVSVDAPKEEVVPEPEIELIVEPNDYTSFPCPRCESRDRCRSDGYKKECVCYALYKEQRRTNVQTHLNIA